ncbi:recombinase family protein [Patescibacteria group bacterium]|nr:recombinase family protein [Patescibacteria group bacterium]
MLNEQTKNKAIIYCRVSSERQMKEGHGIDSQEKRCRDYAKTQNYTVLDTFREEAISGGLFDRPEMKRLLQFLDGYKAKHPTETVVVIFDDLKRFARDVEIHFRLKKDIYGRNGVIESPNFKLEDTPEGKFVETMMAAQSELERNQNKRQVIQKQKARLVLGYWTFCNPPGLKYSNHPMHGKLLVRNEPISTIFKEAIEMYENDRLNTYDEVRDFVRQQYKLNNINLQFGRNGAIKMLSNPLYCGDIEYMPWSVKKRNGHHEGFISRETFEHVQNKMLGRAKKRLRKDYSLDFGLRGFTVCSSCNEPLTASWNRGNGGSYANYWCKTPGCSLRYKSLSKITMENRFKALLEASKPKKGVLRLTHEIMNRTWLNKAKNHELFNTSALKELNEINASIDTFLKRLDTTTKQEMITVYEDKIAKLVKQREELTTKTSSNPYKEKNLGTASAKVFSTVEKPVSLWESDKIEDKRTVMYMYFDNKLVYDRETGFGTAKFSDGYSILKSLEDPKSNLVEMGGIEPPS